MEFQHLIAGRAHAVDASGIRKIFDLAASLKDPANLSIGQPHFDVPGNIRQAASAAIEGRRNAYTPTQGAPDLRQAITRLLAAEFPATLGTAGPDQLPDDTGLLVTSGVSGALMLLMMATIQPGDEVIVPDPYFVMYKHLVKLFGGTPVFADTYPDFQLTPARVEKLITPRTKLVLLCSPGNPTGVVSSQANAEALARLCENKGVLLVSDEIYDAFCHEMSEGKCPSPLRVSRNVVLLRGFSKTWAMTGWRLGYMAGPKAVIDQCTKLQQYSFVCAPSMVQAAGVEALKTPIAHHVADYKKKRDRVVERLSPHYELTVPGGAFYAFPKVPARLGMTGTQFVHAALAKNLLTIPGGVFSERDTHFRISYACADAMLERGLDLLVDIAK